MNTSDLIGPLADAITNQTETTPQAARPTSGGPKTTQGKAVSARNATTHGLFARDVVLTHLGEDPQGYDALLQELTAQIKPQNLMERHYTEKIAAASWRLQRLQRWQAQLFEDPALSEDDLLNKLDRVMRHETALHRQIDTSVKMLGRDVPHLFETRARKEALKMVRVTERDCARDENADWDVEINTRETRQTPAARPLPPDLTPTNCQNEPAPPPPSLPRFGGGGEPQRTGGGIEPRGKDVSQPQGLPAPHSAFTTSKTLSACKSTLTRG